MPTLRDLRSTSVPFVLPSSFASFASLPSRPLRSILCLCLFLGTTAALHAQKWIDPTPAELSMTSIPEVPGAPAVYLNREQITEDDLHMFSFYERLKVLTDRGKDYANVEIKYVAGESGMSVDSIEGRTIHPDGSIIPFAGKPYDKLIVRASGYKEKAKVFTLPSVEVGSIIEYRYKLRMDDMWFREPSWYIQSDLFTRKAHYMWHPTNRDLTDAEGNTISGGVAWSPILPPGVTVKSGKTASQRSEFTVDITNVPPMPTAESMPPLQSVSYRVLFFYTAYHSGEEFWTKTGKLWSKDVDKFIGPGKAVKDYANTLVTPADTPDQKAQKLYAAIMAMDNTDFTREHTTNEDKAAGLRDLKNSDDIVTRKRGSSDQLAETYVALARAVGLKAYLVGVANRSQRLFVASYLSLYRQIDDYIVVVNIDGKDVYLDPGQRYCAYGHLAWPHALTSGIRQTDGGTALINVPAEPYSTAHAVRIADLKLDELGNATGTVTITYTGDTALYWRQKGLRGDEASLKDDLKTNLENRLPGGMDINVTSIDYLTQYNLPLKVSYSVQGAIGSSAGKRLLITADLFVNNDKPEFTEPKRDIAVDLHYAFFTQDAVRLTLPDSLTIESSPEPTREMMKNLALYSTNSKRTPGTITSQRTLQIGTPAFLNTEYPELHAFYAKIAAKDQETIVLTHAKPAAQ